MPPVMELYSQLEELTRRTRSSRMPVTRGGNPTWGNMMTTLGGRRRGSLPDHESGAGRVDGIRRRQDRVGSVPDHRQVEQVRVEERGRGGPPAPHNSLDLSVINLSETVAIDEEPEVFHSFNEVATHEEELSQEEDSSYDDVVGVPPLDPNARAILDAAIAHRSSLDTTIDLTDSPVRSSFSSLPLLSQSPPTPTTSRSPLRSPSSSSLKCPVCLDTFSSIRRRGSRLVSTVCGHVFCGRCLPACVRTSGQCPTCRRRLGYQDFHPLHLY